MVAAASACIAMPWLQTARAQQPSRMYRIAVLSNGQRGRSVDTLVQALQEAGYTEGRNLHIEWRSADSQPERFPALVDEVLRAKVELIVTPGSAATRAAIKTTSTVPIVFMASTDPVAFGLVASLARPGGNVTGTSLALGGSVVGKWLQLLKQAVPTASQVAVLWQGAASTGSLSFVAEVQAAAQAMKVRLDHHIALNPAELDKAITAIDKSAAQALLITGGPLFAARREQLAQFTARRRLPAIGFDARFPEAGGLMGYGPNALDLARRAAVLVDKILKGAKPGDLPVEQPTVYELVVNLKTARALGLVIPQSVLVGASRVIE